MQLIHGDCLLEMPKLAANSIDAIVTDPPYGLSFMGKNWDHGVPGVPFWVEALRVAKPGAILLAFGGTRTFHRLAVAIEDAGWEMRDTIMWVYGSGFPKSHDISKDMDRKAGAERKVVGQRTSVYGTDTASGERVSRKKGGAGLFVGTEPKTIPLTSDQAITDSAKLWQGYGTALKPSWEPILVAMKPPEGTYAENALKWGVAGINVDGCRIETIDTIEQSGELEDMSRSAIHSGYDRPNSTMFRTGKPVERSGPSNPQGRWPANLIHDGSEEVVELFPQTSSGTMKSGQQRKASKGKGGYHNHFPDEATQEDTYGDSGSAARFFYCAKASRAEREAGLEDLPIQHRTSAPHSDRIENRTIQDRLYGRLARNHHPTVKPLALMQYLVRLVKPPQGGVILDPFLGSGTTGMACAAERVDFIGIDTDAEYIEIAGLRIANTPIPLL